MDLFSSGLTVEEACSNLIKEVKLLAKCDGIDVKRAKITVGLGDLSKVGNTMLIVTEPPAAKFFDSGEDRKMLSLLEKYKMSNFIYTYYFWYQKKDKITKADIKTFSPYIHRFSDIIEPRLIVCLGEAAQFSFLKRKAMLRDFHGKQADQFKDIPVYITYPMSYYIEKSEFEDHSYKDFIRDKDWSSIKKAYDEVIK